MNCQPVLLVCICLHALVLPYCCLALIRLCSCAVQKWAHGTRLWVSALCDASARTASGVRVGRAITLQTTRWHRQTAGSRFRCVCCCGVCRCSLCFDVLLRFGCGGYNAEWSYDVNCSFPRPRLVHASSCFTPAHLVSPSVAVGSNYASCAHKLGFSCCSWPAECAACSVLS